MWTYVEGVPNPNPIDKVGVGPSAWPATEFERIIDGANTVFIGKATIEPLEYVTTGYEGVVMSRAILRPTQMLRGEARDAFEYQDADGNLQLVIDFEASKPNWSALSSDFEESQILHAQKRAQDFWFWDNMVFRAPTITAPEVLTSCGPQQVPAISKNLSYLVVIGYSGVEIIEPITFFSKDYIEAVKRRIEAPTQRASKTISFLDFASEFGAATVVEMKFCSRWLRNSVEGKYYQIEDRFDVRQRKTDVRFDIIDTREKLKDSNWWLEYTLKSWPIMFDYFNMSTEEISCSDDQKFLILQRTFEDGFDRRRWHDTAKYPRVPTRFARIYNEEVIISDMKTNYIFSDTKNVPINDVMDLFGSASAAN